MRTVTTFSLIIAFATVAVFGLLTMDHAMAGHGDCAASRAEGVDCPQALGAIGYVDLHAKFFQTLTWAVLFLVVGALVALRAWAGAVSPDDSGDSTRHYRTVRILPGRYHTDLLHWLARFEVSPTTA